MSVYRGGSRTFATKGQEATDTSCRKGNSRTRIKKNVSNLKVFKHWIRGPKKL